MYNSDKNRKKNIFCGNCNKPGHTYRYCREPVISLGILLFYDPPDNFKPLSPPNSQQSLLSSSPLTSSSSPTTSQAIDIPQKKKTNRSEMELAYSPSPPSSNFRPWNEQYTPQERENSLFTENNSYFLLICRKDTFGYVEFIRGRYDVNDEDYLTQLFKEMSREERDRIQNKDFDYLWNKMWINQQSQQYRHEYERSKQLFETISKPNFPKNISYYDKKIPCLWSEPEWGIPKGRRNMKESDLDCAKREFLEETGISESQYTILSHLKPIEETFVGTNDVRYKHVYYLAQCKEYIDLQLDKSNLDQMAEVSKIGWFTAKQAVNLFRPYNIEKIEMIIQTNKLLKSLSDIDYQQKQTEII